jgi:hypothetical protein
MKSNGTTAILNWALAAVVIATLWGATKYFFKTREVRSLQTQIMLYQNKQVVLQNLVNECLEYAKRNPSLDSILEANKIKAPATPSGTKPTSR